MPETSKNDRPWTTPEARYQNDPQFRTLVDAIYHMIRQCEFTPGELRDAVILAATKYEAYHTRPVFVQWPWRASAPPPVGRECEPGSTRED